MPRGEAPLVVGVFFGGPSAEHEVSCASAMGVIRALHRDWYRPVPVGVTRSGDFVLVPEEVVAAALSPVDSGAAIDDRLVAIGPQVLLRPAGDRGVTLVDAACGAPLARLDVVFPVLHGPFGEDGVLQGILTALGVPYVGCGVLASALGMDKVFTKRVLAAAGIPVAPAVSFDESAWRSAPDPARLVAGLRWPLFVKPARMGSSIGISRLQPGDDLSAAVGLALRYDPLVLVEQGVTGRELECGVLGGHTPQASPVGEVRVAGGWFDYRQKYFGTSDPMTVPADLTAEVAEEIRILSVRAFQAIGGWGLARVDFLYDDAAGRLYLNELNTMPGFTAHSMYPKLWAAAGLPYPDLLSRLIDVAYERDAGRRGRVPALGARCDG